MVTHTRWFAGTLALSAMLVACKPEFDDRNSEVVTTRILAVQSEPAEGPPGAPIAYRALAVDGFGARPDLAIDWAFCTQPKPASELNDTTIECFAPSGPHIQPFVNASYSAASAALPLKACNQFGPDVPQIEGQPSSRPTDPDATGGYYQPVRLLVDTGGQYLFALGETRISCNLPGATAEILQSYRQFYHVNRNPEISHVAVFTQTLPSGIDLVPNGVGTDGLVPAGASVDGLVATGAGDDGLVPTETEWVVRAARGERIRLVAYWDSCPETGACGDGLCTPDEGIDNCAADCTQPVGCTGAEPYVSFDLVSHALLRRRESMRISWYANAGSFRDDRTGSGEEAAAQTTRSENEWTAPASPHAVMIWLVARDSRGGVSWKTLRIEVR